MMEAAYVYKICVVGDAGVGKSATVNRWSTGTFKANYQVTVGVQHSTRSVSFDTNGNPLVAKLIIWDMGGQDTFRTIRPIFYKSAKAVILMFDMNNRASFDALNNWVQEADKSVGMRVPFVLVGNKADLEHAVSESEAIQFAETLNAPFIMSSALTGEQVGDIFKVVAEQVHQACSATPAVSTPTVAPWTAWS